MNLDAPRLLAHCFLYELDSFLQNKSNIDFTRFMDDVDIGVDSISDAKQILRSVDLVLQTKQVRLNSGKTLILNGLQAIRHFRIHENAKIDAVQSSVDARVKLGAPLSRQRALIEARIRTGLRKKSFDDGNGDKTLKRWINLAAKTDAKIPPSAIADIIKRRPSVRDSAFTYVRSRPLLPSIAKALSQASKSGLLVDDAAMVEMSNHLVETFVRTRHSQAQINEIIRSNDPKNYFGLYCILWLQSKFSTTANLLATLSDNREIWVPHEQLGRLAASLYPLFFRSREETAMRKVLFETLNPGVRKAYKFHAALASDLNTFNSMYAALSSPSPTRGTGITHAKFLCLLSALKNSAAPTVKIAKLRAIHNRAFEDAYYKGIAKRVGL